MNNSEGQWEHSQPFDPAWVPGNKVLIFDKACVHGDGSGFSGGHIVDSRAAELCSYPDAGTGESLEVMRGLSHIPSQKPWCPVFSCFPCFDCQD